MQALLSLNPTIPCRRGQPNSKSREYALKYSPLLSLFVGTRCRCCRYVMDDVSMVTLPAWPRKGNGRHLVIFRTLSPICILVHTRMLFHFPLLFGSLYCILLYSWLVGVVVVYMFFCGSVVNYCDVTTCDNSTHIACMFGRARCAWWASKDRYYADFGEKR